jgi:2-polyprenyl-3-methyl-5-hydroxy-6-metoxy-1,4-benzoquinol methylase
MHLQSNRSLTAAASVESAARRMAPTCPICDGQTREWLHVPTDWQRPTAGRSYQLYWCDTSDVGFVHPRPTVAEVADFYRLDDYYTHSVTEKRSAASSLVQKVLAHIAWRIDRGMNIDAGWFRNMFGSARRCVLDIGCGNGSLLASLRDLGHDVVGIDPDPVALEVCRKRQFVVYEGSAETLPDHLVRRKFDIVLMSHVLEHTVDPMAALLNARRILADDGFLVVEVPNNRCKGFAQSGIAWPWLDVPRHLTFFTAKSLAAILGRTRFTVAAVQYRGYQRQFSPEWRESEQRAWDAFSTSSTAVLGKRSSMGASWRLLLTTMSRTEADKYDSVRVIARPMSTDR